MAADASAAGGETLFTGTRVGLPEPELPEPLEPRLRRSGGYIPGDALRHAVEVALLVGQPLLLTGEPGTGKTTLARALADERFGHRYLEMQVKSGSGRDDLLYRIDELARFRDAQQRRERRLIDYLELRPLGEAILRACGPDAPLRDRSNRPLTGDESFLVDVLGPRTPAAGPPTARELLPGAVGWTGPERWVVLIDEIDKAPRDTPNDLLEELERMAFAIPELGLRVTPPEDQPAEQPRKVVRPVVVITSNSEKGLPDAFLRRCAYHHIEFPGADELRRIVASRLGDLEMGRDRLDALLALFAALRQDLQRPPGTAELLYWLRLADRDPALREASGPRARPEAVERLVSALVKQKDDLPRAVGAIRRWSKSA